MTLECLYAAVSVALALAVGALVISRITISTLKEALTNARRKLTKLEDPLPVVYDFDQCGKVPLGNLSPVVYRGYKEIELKDKVSVAGDFISDDDNKNKFTLVVVTDKGIFVRTTPPGNSVITKDANSIKIKVNWSVYFGQDALMYNAFIVYKDIIMGHVKLWPNSKMCADDVLNVTYNFDV